jgi:hypothetical protein
MAIPNYIRPQLTIEQILQTTPTATRDRLTAVVIGRQYLLSRFNKEENVYGVGFTTAGLTGATGGIPLKYWDASVGTNGSYVTLSSSAYSVSAADTSLYIDNGEATLFSSTGPTVLGRGIWTVKSASAPNVLVLASASGKLTSSDTGSLYTGLSGREVTVGDIFYAKSTTADADYRRRLVTAVTAQEVTLSGPIVSSTFTTDITATVSATASATASISVGSTAGLYANMPLTAISGTSSFSSGTYIASIAGSVITLSATATAGNGSTISFGNILAALDIAAPVSQTLATTEWALDTTNNQVTVEAAAEVEIAERTSPTCPLRNGKGTLRPSYRALKTVSATEGLILIESPSDIETNLGTISLDNEIAYGASECLSGAQGKAIYALRTSADTTTAYAASLRKIEATDAVYALAPMTDNLEVKQLVATHCESMSAKTVKNFRRCYLGTDSPGEYVALARDTDGTTKLSLAITVTAGLISADLSNTDIDLRTYNLTEGDLVKVIDSNGNYTGAEYLIDSVTDADSLILSTGPTVSGTDYVEFWKADTAANQIDYVVQVSTGLASRRAVNVWVENGTRLIDGVSTVIPNKYVAAEVAGLRTAVVAWQGLTMTEISSITDAPAMYTRYNTSDLNTASAGGVMVITQEAEAGTIFIRHQLTTQTSAGSLAYEDSVGTSLDFISFQIKDSLGGFIGKKNVTPQTLSEIYTTCWTLLNDATKVAISETYGPQLNGFQDRDGKASSLNVEVHPTLKDRVNVYAKLLMPLPLNNIDVILDATVDFAL